MISFYFNKNSIFEKARKTAKNEENQRKSLVFSPLSIKTATHVNHVPFRYEIGSLNLFSSLSARFYCFFGVFHCNFVSIRFT